MSSREGRIDIQVVALAWGALAMIGMIAGFLPALIFINWINLIFAGAGLALSVAALVTSQPRQNGRAIIAMVANGIPVVIGILQLTIGSSPL